MSKRSRRRNSPKHHSRRRRGGANAPLGYTVYGSGGAGQWSPASVNGNAMAAGANSFKSLHSNIGAESGGSGQNPNLASKMLSDFALRGGQSGGGSKRRRRSPRRRQAQSQSQSKAQSQSQSQSQAQSGGMFATFGALLQEALVPLGLLAAQQSYGKKYDSKRRTRKNK